MKQSKLEMIEITVNNINRYGRDNPDWKDLVFDKGNESMGISHKVYQGDRIIMRANNLSDVLATLEGYYIAQSINRTGRSD
jgi:hypothetical protein